MGEVVENVSRVALGGVKRKPQGKPKSIFRTHVNAFSAKRKVRYLAHHKRDTDQFCPAKGKVSTSL